MTEINKNKMLLEILKYYECPSECNSACCKGLDIALCMEDTERISNANADYREKLKVLAEIPDDWKEVNGRMILSMKEKIIPKKPCPFLNEKSLCSIQPIKPISCELYPFLINQETNLNISSYPLRYSIAICSLGLDIFLDYIIYVAQEVKLTPEIDDYLYQSHEFLVEYMQVDRTDLSKIQAVIFPHFEALQNFLKFLKTDNKIIRLITRQVIKEGLMEDSQKRYSQKP